jgi:hypothetical protein
VSRYTRYDAVWCSALDDDMYWGAQRFFEQRKAAKKVEVGVSTYTTSCAQLHHEQTLGFNSRDEGLEWFG